MPEFENLTLTNTDMPSNIELNYISLSESIEDVLINIYKNENPNITFEELKQKIIDFYFNEASEEMIEDHWDILTSNLNESIIQHIFETIMYDEYSNEKEYILNAIKTFVGISLGEEYLYDVFIKIRIE